MTISLDLKIDFDSSPQETEVPPYQLSVDGYSGLLVNSGVQLNMGGPGVSSKDAISMVRRIVS